MTIPPGDERGLYPERQAGGAARAPSASSKSFIRGSSLLLVGKVLSVLVNFLVQVLAVRYLAKSDYGAFAWALSMAAMGSSIVLLGLNRTVARFASIHHERGEYDRMFGTVAFALGTVSGVGLAVVALVLGLQGLIAGQVESDLSVGLLLILIGLTPIDALDALFETLMAVFAGARSIFFRRYVLGPGLKLAAVLLVVSVQGSVQLLAATYLTAGFLGISLYALLFWQVLARKGLLDKLDLAHLVLQPRTLLAYSLPVLTTDILLALETPMVVFFLERYRSTVEVAELRAVAPIAGLCVFVYQQWKILFKPHAARFFARGDEAGLGELYWRSAAWIAIVSFPVFALCLFLAEPVALFVCGRQYAGVGVLLAILATGKYFNAALGMNTFTLQVHARVWLIVAINALSAVLGLWLCLWLVPQHGALGGALATAAAIVIRNVMYQAGLIATTRAGVPPAPALRVYASILAAIALLGAVRWSTHSVFVLVPAVAAASLFLPWFNRRFLDVMDTFPELARVPLLRRYLGLPAG
jgi:O-antigen/teichoic acid export membrane protein